MTRVSDLSFKNKYTIPIEKCEILWTAREEHNLKYRNKLEHTELVVIFFWERPT